MATKAIQRSQMVKPGVLDNFWPLVIILPDLRASLPEAQGGVGAHEAHRWCR